MTRSGRLPMIVLIKGRVDFVMASKMRDLNATLKELKRRKSDTISLMRDVKNILSDLRETYRSVKKKIVNA